MDHLQAATYTVQIAPVTAATTARTASFSIAEAVEAGVLVTLGAQANTNATSPVLTIAHGDGTNFTTLQTTAIANTAAVSQYYPIVPHGRDKYIKLTITPDTTTNGAVLFTAASIVKSNRQSAPTNAAV